MARAADSNGIEPHRTPRMRVLSVVSSSNQLYSGIGRNLFELARALADRVEFTFAIDDATPRNVDLLVAFAREIGAQVWVGPACREPDALDTGNADLPVVLEECAWDLVECLCWANAATNSAVLRHAGRTPIAYTPHDQPLWTVPMSPEQASRTAAVHREVVRRAELVLCDSRHERRTLERLAPGSIGLVELPLGCDFRVFRPCDVVRRPQLLFVGDLCEPRKRFDRVLAVFERLRHDRPELRLAVIGNDTASRAERVPPHLRGCVDLLGYVDEDALRRAYRESLGLFLLSDYEAFGIPIIEALACGTPAFVTPLESTVSLFEGLTGIVFCPADDLDASHAAAASALESGDELRGAIARSWPRLRTTFDWPELADRKWRHLRAAWARRHGLGRCA